MKSHIGKENNCSTCNCIVMDKTLTFRVEWLRFQFFEVPFFFFTQIQKFTNYLFFRKKKELFYTLQWQTLNLRLPVSGSSLHYSTIINYKS